MNKETAGRPPLLDGEFVETVIVETDGAMLDRLSELLPPGPVFPRWVSVQRNANGFYCLSLFKSKPEESEEMK